LSRPFETSFQKSSHKVFRPPQVVSPHHFVFTTTILGFRVLPKAIIVGIVMMMIIGGDDGYGQEKS
jgi:hypothetical protein